VAIDDLLVDVALGVLNELLAGGRELGHISGEGLSERAQRLRPDAPVRVAEFSGRELLAVAVALDRHARDLDSAARAPADRLEQLLPAHARARVPQHER